MAKLANNVKNAPSHDLSSIRRVGDRRVLLTNFNALSANVPQFNRTAVSQPRTIGVDLHYKF